MGDCAVWQVLVSLLRIGVDRCGFWVGRGSKGEQSCAVSGVGFGTASGCRWSLRVGLYCGNVTESGADY